MLQRLQARNFQRWDKLDVEFDPVITTFVGPTDVGKSSIIRLLRWLAFNRPIGTDFMRWGSDMMAGRLTVDGHVLERRRTARVNGYAIDGKKYKALGRAVPEAVAALLNVTPINFQMQHDLHYWFSLHPGQVSKELNAIVDLDVIDRFLTNLATTRRRAAMAADLSTERIATAKAAVEKLEYIETCDKELKLVEDHAHHAAMAKKRAALLHQRATRAAQGGAHAHATAMQARGGARVVAAGERARTARTRATALGTLATNAEEYALTAVAPKIGRLEKLFEAAAGAQSAADGLGRLIAWAKKTGTQADAAGAALAAAQKEFKEYTKGKECPTCGKIMT